VGLLILLLAMTAMRGFASWERQLGDWLLGAHIPPPNPGPELKRPLKALKKHIVDSYTWKSLIYFMIKFPLGIISFVLAISLMSFSLALLLTPLLYRSLPIHFFEWRITSAEASLFCLAIGLILGLLTFHIMHGLAAIHRALASAMLAGTPAERAEARKGPIVIP